MSARNLYLYEVVDVIGQGQYDYMEHLWKDPVQQMPDMDKLRARSTSAPSAAAGGRR